MFDLPVKRTTLGNGLKTRVFDSGGGGVPVLLLHGLSLSIEIWGKVIPGLAADRRVIAFDFPGFGDADRPDARYDSPFFVAQILALLDAMALERAHIIGSSLGGSALVRMSVAHADRVGSAVLMAPGGFGREANPALRLPTLPVIGYPMGKPTWLSNAFALRLAMADKRFATRALIDLVNSYSQRPGSHRAFVRTVKAGLTPLACGTPRALDKQRAALTALCWSCGVNKIRCSRLPRQKPRAGASQCTRRTPGSVWPLSPLGKAA
jgi:pimeloyl-ACP methyl ester carboxylesterase